MNEETKNEGIVITKKHVKLAGYGLVLVWLLFFYQRSMVIIDTGLTPKDPIELVKYLVGIGDTAEQFRMKTSLFKAFN